VEDVAIGIPNAVVTGANYFRLNRGRGLKLSRDPIADDEIRDDGQTGLARLGSKKVEGILPANISRTTFDPLFEAVLRGTWATGQLIQPAAPIDRSFSFEQYLKGVDNSRLFVGCRVSSMKVTFGANARATVEFGIVGIDQQLLTGAAAPFFTPPPARTTTPSFVSIDAAIEIDGVAALNVTGGEFTLDLGAAGIAVVGSALSPDIWPDNAKLNGSLNMTRQNATREQAWLAETPFALVVTMSEPSPSTSTLAFTLPVCQFMDYDEALGESGPLIATLPFSAGQGGVNNTMIQLDDTP
jgi:hypothetical protein